MPRLYFVLGDLLACLAVGWLAGWATEVMVASGGSILLGMMMGMGVGMGIAVLLMFPLTILLGAMEVMIPVMLGGMLAGMAVGMARAMGHLPPDAGAWQGALVGVTALMYTWMMHLKLRGVVNHG